MDGTPLQPVSPTDFADAGDHRIRPQTLQGEVLNRLRDEIISGVWKPGARLQERLLSERFGISRSPLREALQVLAAEGFLELHVNRGAVVSSPTLHDVLQNHRLLVALECLGIELACEIASDADLAAVARTHEQERAAAQSGDEDTAYRLNNELHRAIVLASHNAPLIEAHLIVWRRIIRMQNINELVDPDCGPPAAEHDAFVAPLLRRDRDAAVAGLRRHHLHVEDNLKERLRATARKAQRATG
jgi:DNA-binding GntR family transcriptional regulator